MNVPQKFIVLTAAALVSSTSFAALMTEQQIRDEALQLQPGTVQSSHMEQLRDGSTDIWRVEVNGSDNMLHTLYFNARTGKRMDPVTVYYDEEHQAPGWGNAWGPGTGKG